MTETPMTPFRFLLSVACAALLAGCSSSSTNAAASPEASSAAVAVAAPAPGARRPCDLPGAWTFQGSCVLVPVSADGADFTLPAYRGIGIELSYGANDAKGKIPFIAADAVGDNDISGLLNGTIAFPLYGRICVTQARTAVPCTGTPLIYFMVVNGGRSTVKFKASPAILVASQKGFPGNDCGIDTMIWSDARHGKAAWMIHPYSSAPTGQQFRVDPRQVSQTYASGGSFSIFAVVCG